MRNLISYDDFLNESKAPGIREINKVLAVVKEKLRYIPKMKEFNSHVATEPIVFTLKDFTMDTKPSATGNYLLTIMYEMKDSDGNPGKKIEFIKLEPNPKHPSTMGTYARFVDEKEWERFFKAHKDQMVEPNHINPKVIMDLVTIVEGFINSELALIFPPNAPKPPVGEGLEDQLKDKLGDAEIYGVSDDRLRINFFFKRQGDGKAVPKTNLFFIVNPNGQSVEFKNPDKINPIQDTWTDIRNLIQIIRARIAEWKEEDKQKYMNASQEAFRQER